MTEETEQFTLDVLTGLVKEYSGEFTYDEFLRYLWSPDESTSISFSRRPHGLFAVCTVDSPIANVYIGGSFRFTPEDGIGVLEELIKRRDSLSGKYDLKQSKCGSLDMPSYTFTVKLEDEATYRTLIDDLSFGTYEPNTESESVGAIVPTGQGGFV